MPVAPLNPPLYQDVRFFKGDPGAVPYDVQMRRFSTWEVMQRMGTPVLVKPMYTIEDVENGIAKEAPTMDDIYKQSSYANDQLSYGMGYVSVETQPGEWFNPSTGEVYSANTPQNEGDQPAPKYRGFGPGFLTYAILPDRPEDTWKLNEAGALIRQQTAMIQFPWFPEISDNDLVIIVDLSAGGAVAHTYERYLLKMVTPLTMRGSGPAGGFRSDWGGYRESDIAKKDAGGNRFWVGQQAELTKIPTNELLYNVETDR